MPVQFAANQGPSQTGLFKNPRTFLIVFSGFRLIGYDLIRVSPGGHYTWNSPEPVKKTNYIIIYYINIIKCQLSKQLPPPWEENARRNDKQPLLAAVCGIPLNSFALPNLGHSAVRWSTVTIILQDWSMLNFLAKTMQRLWWLFSYRHLKGSSLLHNS